MKKSEAILKAAQEFQERSDNQQYPGYSHEELAKEFLSIFEEIIGMLPPTVENLDYRKIYGGDHDFEPLIDYVWESEE